MGSSRPKWLIKQERTRLAKARRVARLQKGDTKDLKIRRLARKGGRKIGQAV